MDTSSNDMDREILERRANELAKPVERLDMAEERVALLEFSLMGTRYAVPLEKVQAVVRIGEIFTVPMTPHHISGIIRRRGRSIALVNLRRFFNARAEGFADADFAVIVSAGEKCFAIQVEDIQGAFQMVRGSLSPPPDNFDPQLVAYVSGVTLDGLTVIDLEALVAAEGFSAGRGMV